MVAHTTIAEQVKAAQAGEEAAWQALYQHYYPSLYATALHLYKYPSAARDAVQDAFLTAYLKLAQLNNAATFGSWLRTILLHHCFRARQHSRMQTAPEPLHLPDNNSLEEILTKKLDALLTKSRLYNALMQLPDVLRSTLLLRYFSGFRSYDAMASILGVPVGTIRSRLNQAKTKLREQWQQRPAISMDILKSCARWDHFYYTVFSGMHRHDDYKNQFIGHLQKDVQLRLPGGIANTGRRIFEKKVMEDRAFGSWMNPTNVVSCGNISVVETRHFNSPEYPNHCPESSVLVLHRTHEKVTQLYLYSAPQ